MIGWVDPLDKLGKHALSYLNNKLVEVTLF